MKEEILKEIKENKKDDSDISIIEAFNKIKDKIKFNETNEIYYYQIGLDEGLSDVCKLYWNLETNIPRWIDLKDCEEFERAHKIITGHEYGFSLVQKEFIIGAVKKIEKSIEKINKFRNVFLNFLSCVILIIE